MPTPSVLSSSGSTRPPPTLKDERIGWRLRTPIFETQSTMYQLSETKIAHMFRNTRPFELNSFDGVEVDRSGHILKVLPRSTPFSQEELEDVIGEERRDAGEVAMRVLVLGRDQTPEEGLDIASQQVFAIKYLAEELGVSPLFFEAAHRNGRGVILELPPVAKDPLEKDSMNGVYYLASVEGASTTMVWFSHNLRTKVSTYVIANFSTGGLKNLVNYLVAEKPYFLAVDSLICEDYLSFHTNFYMAHKNAYEMLSKLGTVDKTETEDMKSKVTEMYTQMYNIESAYGNKRQVLQLLKKLVATRAALSEVVAASRETVTSPQSKQGRGEEEEEEETDDEYDEEEHQLDGEEESEMGSEMGSGSGSSESSQWQNMPEETNQLLQSMESILETRQAMVKQSLMHLTSMTNFRMSLASSEIARDTKTDSSSMTTISLVTMIFLPGSVVASFFSTLFVNQSTTASHGIKLSEDTWIYFAVTIFITSIVFAAWIHRHRRHWYRVLSECWTSARLGGRKWTKDGKEKVGDAWHTLVAGPTRSIGREVKARLRRRRRSGSEVHNHDGDGDQDSMVQEKVETGVVVTPVLPV